jgi:general secretion pathway protein K
VEQLVWLGLPLETVAALQPYITVLPASDVKVNLNTAGAEVIYAAVNGITMADAQRLVAEREQAHFRTLAGAQQLMPQHTAALTEGTVGVGSSYFEVIGRLRLNELIVQERSLVSRNGTVVNTLYRERGVADATALSQAAAGPRR